MSKYLAFTEVVFKDRALLVSALEQVGCTEVIQGENLAMGRYWAEQAETRADVIVPRGVVGNGFGDIGFMRVEGGGYAPVLDDLDKERARSAGSSCRACARPTTSWRSLRSQRASMKRCSAP